MRKAQKISSRDLILKAAGLNLKDKLELRTLKKDIDHKTLSLQDQVVGIIKDLLIIEQRKLYYFDGCSSMRSFIDKNRYPDKLSLKYGSITQKLSVERYIHKNKFDDEVRQAGTTKLILIAGKNINDEREVKDLTKYSVSELKRRLSPKSCVTGRFIRSDFKRRQDTKIVAREFEILKRNSAEFLISLNSLCKAFNVEVI